MGSPVGTSPFCFPLPLRLLLLWFHQAFVGCSLVFILVSVSGVFSLPFRISAWFPSALLVGVVVSIFSAFSFRSVVLDCWWFVLPVLYHSSMFRLWGFRPSFWGSPFRVYLSSSLFLSAPDPFGFCSFGLG